ncbi:MAG: zinc-ribbon domain-containing protein [Bryobacteraceae bacterium]|nr:zinc-ribbon domain-containing protein [Bryobacteraceae bacterium]
MPFCTQCGNEVRQADVFCGRCGARQRTDADGPSAARRDAGKDLFENVDARTASIVCYIPIIGWIPAIAVLAAQRYRKDQTVRFHAWQGLYLFVGWLLVDWVADPIFEFVPGPHFVTKILKAVILGAWVLMLIKTSQNETFRLPLFGDLAERSVTEQR